MSNIDLKGWNVAVSENGQYLFITHKDKPGTIQLKADDEGFVADIRDTNNECASTTYALYHELSSEV